LPYRLEDSEGRVIGNDKHYLSMKDNDQSANLRALIDAGISSFKIEGRYKDLPYVKNATAHYRQLLDEILNHMPEYAKTSSGISTFSFTPQPEKTFNRSATDYFVNGRKADIGAFDTPKFAGEEVGKVTKVGQDYFEMTTAVELHNGDGLCFFDVHKELVGMRINTVNGNRLVPNEMPEDMRRGMTLYRNRDHAFMRLLEKDSATRKIGVDLNFYETPDGFGLTVTDEDGCSASAFIQQEKQPAQNLEKAEANLRDNLTKLGGTDFSLRAFNLSVSQAWFLPASAVNGLRRDAIEQLIEVRVASYQRPAKKGPVEPPATYPEDTLSYLANVYNKKARAFYEKHGVKMIAAAYEANQELGEVPLMITKHCLRFSHGMCPKEAKGVIGVQGTVTAEPMTLINGNDKFTLKFDCKPCEMHVMGKIRKPILQMPPPQPLQFFPRAK
jgi:putative protease